MKVLTNHRYALITGIVLALVLSYALHQALVPDSEFNHLSLARWVHIVAGVFWIGLLYYFNAVQVPALASDPETQRAILEATVAAWSNDYTAAHGLGAIDPAVWESAVTTMTALPGSVVAAPVQVEDLITDALLP